MDEITKYITSHANLVVAVLLAVIALTVVIFGAIVTMWIKPKLDLLDTLRGDVLLRSTTAATHALDLRINALETTTNAFPDLGALKGAVETLSATHTQESLLRTKS